MIQDIGFLNALARAQAASTNQSLAKVQANLEKMQASVASLNPQAQPSPDRTLELAQQAQQKASAPQAGVPTQAPAVTAPTTTPAPSAGVVPKEAPVTMPAQSPVTEADITKAVLDTVKSVAQAFAPAAPAQQAAPTVTGTTTVKQPGGVIETYQLMSDGTRKLLSTDKNTSARDAVMAMFSNTGLGKDFTDSLIKTIDNVYAANIDPTDDQILNSIYNSDAYKTRFSANEAIRQRLANGKGMPGDRLLTPKEYVDTENTYRDLMQAAGLPTGFYDQPEDFTKFIENNTSAAEISSRINVAKQALQDADQNIVNALKTYYGFDNSELAAYMLDPTKAMDLVNARQFKYTAEQGKRMLSAAQVGAAAERAGMQAGKEFATEIVTAGKEGQAEQAYQTAAQSQKDYARLMGIAGEAPANQEDLVRQQLNLAGGAEVSKKIKKAASQERARFQQQSALDRTSLSRKTNL